MAVIRGKFLYGAYYQSLDEMINDEYLEADRIVKVKTGIQETSYFITEIKGEDSIQIKNGLYAVQTLIGNSSSSSSKKQYVRNSGIDEDLGFLKKGLIPKYSDTNDLFDAMLYDGFCVFSIKTNLNEEIHVKGERHTITRVILTFTRCESTVTQIKVSINGINQIKAGKFVQGNIVEIPIEATIYNDTDIIVTASNADLSKVQVKSLKFRNPVYYSMIDPSARPGSESIKRMNRVMEPGILRDSHNLQNTAFFIAVPVTYTLKSVKDENGIPSENIFSSYNVNITHDQDTTTYKAYYSRGLYLDDYSMDYLLEEL